MLPLFFIYLLTLSSSFSFAVTKKNDVCGCYDICEENFTSNSIKDIQKVTACQRGCRFFVLVFHTSHEPNPVKDSIHAKEGCLLSCSESYTNPFEVSGCHFGCSTVESSVLLCNTVENQISQISYSSLIEESEVLIHPGEPDPDDSLTDPGLRKQFQKTLAALLDATPKIPEIHFRNLPITTEKLTEVAHPGYKCPKFYGLDSKFEFRNGKIIIGDLYLFAVVFIFVVICFVLGHHIETKNTAKQLMESRILKNQDLIDKEPLLKMETDQEDLIQVKKLPEYGKLGNELDPIESSLESITLVFREDELSSKDSQREENSLKI